MRLMLLRLQVITILKQLALITWKIENTWRKYGILEVIIITDPRSSLTETKSSRGVQFPGQDAADENGRGD